MKKLIFILSCFTLVLFAKPNVYEGDIIYVNKIYNYSDKQMDIFIDYDVKVRYKLWSLMGEPVENYHMVWTPKIIKVINKCNGKNELIYLKPEEYKDISLYEFKAQAKVNVSIEAMKHKNYGYIEFDIGVGKKPYLPKNKLLTNVGLEEIDKKYFSYNVPGSPSWEKYIRETPKSYISKKEAIEAFKSGKLWLQEREVTKVSFDVSSIKEYVYALQKECKEKIAKEAIAQKEAQEISSMKKAKTTQKKVENTSFEAQLDDIFDEKNIEQEQSIYSKKQDVKQKYKLLQTSELEKIKKEIELLNQENEKIRKNIELALLQKKEYIDAHANQNAMEPEILKVFYDEKHNNCGYKDEKGQIIIPPKYHRCKEFSEGVAFVENGEKYAVIDTKGKLLTDFLFTFDYARLLAGEDYFKFGDGLACVSKTTYGDSLLGYINTKGETVIDFKYYSCGYFSEGIAPVRKKYGLSGTVYYIDKTGKTVFTIEAEYRKNSWLKKFGPYINGLARVSDNYSSVGFLNKQGEYVLGVEKFDVVTNANKDGLLVGINYKDSYNFTVYNKNGNVHCSFPDVYEEYDLKSDYNEILLESSIVFLKGEYYSNRKNKHDFIDIKTCKTLMSIHSNTGNCDDCSPNVTVTCDKKKRSCLVKYSYDRGTKETEFKY